MKPFFLSAMLMLSLTACAKNIHQFSDCFSDSTLRLDYIFSGTNKNQTIGLSKKTCTPGWAGRRHNLEKMPLKGNGQFIVTEPESGDTIYATSFSSLFIEWLDTDEANETQKAMEEVMLMPMPVKPVDINVTINNHRGEPISKLVHRISPDDILIKRPSVKNVTPHKYIHKSGNAEEKIDVAILAEGYTVAEMDSFYRHAEIAVESILSHEPFKSMANCFNFVAVASPSTDSGVSIPRLNDWKHTAFSSHFSTFYSNRYLTTSSVGDIHDSLTGIPYEHIIILANTPEYGGGGIYNSYTLTTARHPLFRPVVTHEFGHSFGGLADEYFHGSGDVMNDTYPQDVEPWEQNVTTLVDFKSKWADMLEKDTEIPTNKIDGDKIGVYEGAAYSTKGVFRPYDHCRMRDNEAPAFCPVCQRAIARIIEFYISVNK